ncbi:hypothetical protein ABZ235_36120 [Streptomyces canus]|uniref:hypothetical protein n=1 Tax=Streptomyces canus TaxID=58343 RepID=UPI0033BE783C
MPPHGDQHDDLPRAAALTDGTRDDLTNARLEQENARPRHAVDFRATVDQAIGALTAAHRLAPTAGFEVAA